MPRILRHGCTTVVGRTLLSLGKLRDGFPAAGKAPAVPRSRGRAARACPICSEGSRCPAFLLLPPRPGEPTAWPAAGLCRRRSARRAPPGRLLPRRPKVSFAAIGGRLDHHRVALLLRGARLTCQAVLSHLITRKGNSPASVLSLRARLPDVPGNLDERCRPYGSPLASQPAQKFPMHLGL